MDAKYFFQNIIKDNNYQGFSLGENIVPSWKDDIFHNKKRYKERHRKEGIASYIKELHKNVASKDMSELNISYITFDDEFEANKDQKIFEIIGDTFDSIKIYTGNIVGSIVYKSHNVNINCRFGNNFLQYMIANTSGFLELENLGNINKDLGLGEWILTYYWKLQLRKAFSLGLYKTYQKKKENLSFVKGTIDLNSLLKKGYFDGKTLCNFKEHSYKNELNSVISMALTKVFKSKYQPIVADIYNIKNAFDSINTEKLALKSVFNRKVRNPYFKQYNQVFDLSLKILKNEFASVGDSNSEFSAFLFDISLLFEHHIRKILKQKFTLFPKNKKEFVVPNGIYESNIYPDVIIDFGNNEIGVYDVKYKNFNFLDGVERKDRFQIVTYVATHLENYKVKECGIIYPLRESDFEKTQRVKNQLLHIHLQEIPFKVKFYKISSNIENQSTVDNEFINEVKPDKLEKLLRNEVIVVN